MTIRAFENAMCEINEKYIAEALNYSKETSAPRFRRRLSVALIAALIALFLMGAGVVAVIYGDSIQNWFEYYWEIITGQPMSEEQAAVIDHLSQEVGLSQTVGDTTVTVDSVTVGNDILYLLLRVDGPSFSKRDIYNFNQYNIAVSPDPLEGTDGMGAIGLQFHGLDGDNSAIFLMKYVYANEQGFVEDTTPLEVTVQLEDFGRGLQAGQEELLTEGRWDFSFTIDRSQLPVPLSLPDAEVTMYDMNNELVTVKHTNMELTAIGLRFQCDYDAASRIDYGQLIEAPPHITEMDGTLWVAQTYAVLENGLIVEAGDGTGILLKDSNLLSCSFHWSVPINLDEVVAIQFGKTQIPVPFTTSP